MRIQVQFQNPRTGEVKAVKVGWSWSLFLLSGVFGLPLFGRKLHLWGTVFLALSLLNLFGRVALPEGDQLYLLVLFLTVVGIGLSAFQGIKGNELTAKNYLNHGWQFADPDSDATRFGKLAWRLGDMRSGPATTRIEPSF